MCSAHIPYIVSVHTPASSSCLQTDAQAQRGAYSAPPESAAPATARPRKFRQRSWLPARRCSAAAQLPYHRWQSAPMDMPCLKSGSPVTARWSTSPWHEPWQHARHVARHVQRHFKDVLINLCKYSLRSSGARHCSLQTGASTGRSFRHGARVTQRQPLLKGFYRCRYLVCRLHH